MNIILNNKMFTIIVMTLLIMSTSVNAFLKTGAAYLTEVCSLKNASSAIMPIDVMVKMGLGVTAATMFSKKHKHVFQFHFYKPIVPVVLGGLAGYCLKDQRLVMGCLGAFVGIQLYSKMIDMCFKKPSCVNEWNELKNLQHGLREDRRQFLQNENDEINNVPFQQLNRCLS